MTVAKIIQMRLPWSETKDLHHKIFRYAQHDKVEVITWHDSLFPPSSYGSLFPVILWLDHRTHTWILRSSRSM